MGLKEWMVSIHHLVQKFLERMDKKDELSIHPDPQIYILPIWEDAQRMDEIMENKLS